jgi:hypothetical protein
VGGTRAAASGEHQGPHRGYGQDGHQEGRAGQQKTQARIEQEDEHSRKGVAIGWFVRYRNADGQLYSLVLAAYLFLTIVPATLAMATYAARSPTEMANRLIARLGSPATPRPSSGGCSRAPAAHQLAATLIAVASVILFGLGIPRTLQLVYGKAWAFPLAVSSSPTGSDISPGCSSSSPGSSST